MPLPPSPTHAHTHTHTEEKTLAFKWCTPQHRRRVACLSILCWFLNESINDSYLPDVVILHDWSGQLDLLRAHTVRHWNLFLLTTVGDFLSVSASRQTPLPRSRVESVCPACECWHLPQWCLAIYCDCYATVQVYMC